MVWRKVWRDLWRNKLRTLLVVLSTAVGVFALGLVFGSSGVMRARMTESHVENHSPHIEMYTGLFDQDMVEAIEHEEGVVEAEGEIRSSIRWKLEGETEWREGTIIAREDYETQRIYPMTLLEGEWPAGRVLAAERMSSSYYDLPIDTTILVRVGQRERQLTLGGVVRHPYTPPPHLGSDATFCGSLETVAWISDHPEGFNTLNVRLASFSQEKAEEVAAQIEERFNRAGFEDVFYNVVDPEVHWAQEMMDAIFLILAVLGGLALGLSGFLIINIMNAIVTQQVWQIGVMKVLGATVGRVIRVYLAIALIYGLLSLLVAVPLGALGAHLLSTMMLDLFNIVDNHFRVMWGAVALQAAMALLVPLLAALVPVIGGARISAHRAISTYGLGGRFGRGWLDRLIGSIRSVPRLVAMGLRNTFRRKARIALTMLALTIGGVMFIMVLSVGASLSNTIDVLLNDFGFDVLIVFDRAHRTARLVEAAESVSGVTTVEVWDVRSATMAQRSGEEMQGQLWGVPDNSVMFNPRIVGGRALLPDDDHAILLNSKIAADEDIQVGETITLTVGGRQTAWTVVGLVVNLNNNQRDNFVPFDALAQDVGNVNRGTFVMAMADGYGSEDHRSLVRDLRAAFEERRMKPVFFQSSGELRQQTRSQFNIIVGLMLGMAVLAAVVGSIGLMGTMSINVVERGREIGVMRAIGATSLAIGGIFVGEGLLAGFLSWLFAVPLSYPGALVFSNVVGEKLLELPLDFKFPLWGAGVWLFIVLVLSAIASFWPAVRATRVSVQESLAYE